MNPGPGAVAAYTAGVLLSGRRSSAIYDYSEGGYRQISGTVGPGHVNVYDHQDLCPVSGSGTATYLSLYHYGEGAYLPLDLRGGQLHGYDCGTGSHFTGNVSGNTVTLYDYGEGAYFTYTL